MSWSLKRVRQWHLGNVLRNGHITKIRCPASQLTTSKGMALIYVTLVCLLNRTASLLQSDF